MAIQTVLVAGAGNMGSGIAQAFAGAGFRTLLHDVDATAIQRGMDRIRKPLEKRVTEGKMPAADLEKLLANLHPAPDLASACKDVDLAIEAVFEDLKVKTDLFRRLDAACPPQAILATNTSSLYVKDLAEATKRPERVVGLHFFFPAAINKLLEVVRGPKTAPEVFAAAYDAGKKAGKVPIETADAPGFAVNRFFVPWINEACRLLDEGDADIPTIETAAKAAFGITMGPFELMNVTGVPISLHAQSTLHRELGAFYEPAKSLRHQVERKENWVLAGEPDPELFAEVSRRLRGVVFGIACHLVGEKVATLRDTDRGATIGLRWPTGPFAMMNANLREAAEEVRAVHKHWNDAFPIPPALEEHAKAGRPWAMPAVTLEAQDEGRMATITFDRPEALNALDANVLRDLDHCLAQVEGSAARAVIVTGEGKAFIAGADIPTMKALDAAGAQGYTELGNRVLDRLAGLPCPVIMAINGFAFGGGLELALCGDLLIASEKAQLGLPEVGLGIHPGFGGTQRLPRRIGLGAAKDLVLTGRTVGAAEAKSMGLVNEVVPAGDLLSRAQAIARTIAEKAPLAVAGAKASMEQGLGMDLRSGLQVEQESVVLLFSSKDKDEGLAAFLERRKPAFRGE